MHFQTKREIKKKKKHKDTKSNVLRLDRATQQQTNKAENKKSVEKSR